ncbi:DUF711 family protein [Sulfurospirillum arcachonense]|uniref:DUF711 family protein n=1 Tax=Sulfurospirillum arcachonense TaxID=57666 RepID=UPI0004684620|nr:DUF711 family protein [Sulfurospirillum arcachonense]
MIYQNKNLCKVRTVTTFITLKKDKLTWKEEILKASQFCHDLSSRFIKNGYIVQSIRIVTNAFGEYLNTSSLEKAKEDLEYISNLLNSLDVQNLRIRFAIGEAKTKEEIALLPELIRDFGDLCNTCVNVPMDEFGVLDNHLINLSSSAVQKIAQITPRGEGNFNFTVNFNCKSLIPYFPASYHNSSDKNCFVLGLETPDLLVEVLKDFNLTCKDLNHNEKFKKYYEIMSEALQYHVDNIRGIVEDFDTKEFVFRGIDSSAAPSKNCSSMCEVYEELGVEYFGASGSVEASSLLTKVFKSLKNIELVGFSGLMLAVTEDIGLAEGTIKEQYDLRSLLTYSSVCGIGLDTVPIPGDVSLKKLNAIMRDTGTMAFRLNKPLTVRVFPVPNRKAGKMTAFESDDLCNCKILEVK